MASDADLPSPAPSVPPSKRARTVKKVAFLAFGVAVALYLRTQGPQDQHVRVVLGSAAPQVSALDIRYLGSDGDVVREVHFDYPIGAAPRVVSHEPRVPNGEYQLQINADTREGRRELQRRVTLGGGSTQIDVASALTQEKHAPEAP